MPIVPSRSPRIQELLVRLASAGAAERESAVAGLTLLGPRVLEPLRAFLPGAGRAARLAALEVLDRLEDRAALPLVLELTRDGDEAVAVRAVEAAGARPDRRAAEGLAPLLVAGTSAPRRRAAARALARQARGHVEALDVLVARLLDEHEEAGLRTAILQELLAFDPPLPPATVRPLLKRLSESAAPELAALAASPGSREGADDRLVAELVAPGRPAAVVERAVAALARRGAPAIPRLLKALDALGPLRGGPEAARSLRARAALHEALAALDSRAALFDLRETIEARPRFVLPAILRATARIGDASVVPSLARAVAEDAALLEPCAETLASIAAREGLRRKPASQVRPEHRAALDSLWARAKVLRLSGRGAAPRR